MLRLLLVASFIILGSCVTTEDLSKLEQRLEERLEDRIKRNHILMSYYRDHDSCFINYNRCKVDRKDRCWEKHEACVISVHRQYQDLMGLTPIE